MNFMNARFISHCVTCPDMKSDFFFVVSLTSHLEFQGLLIFLTVLNPMQVVDIYGPWQIKMLISEA